MLVHKRLKYVLYVIWSSLHVSSWHAWMAKQIYLLQYLFLHLGKVRYYENNYLLLTEFEGRTISYGPSFFPFDLWPKREARGSKNRKGKNDDT